MKRIALIFTAAVLGVFLTAGGFALPVSAKSGYKPLAEKDIAGMSAAELLQYINGAKGKVVVVNIFASWCPPCRDEVPGLIKLRDSLPESKVAVIGVSIDQVPRALVSFVNDMKVNYPIRLASGDFVDKVGVRSVPQLFIYNKAGELVVNHRGLVDADNLDKAVREILAE